MSQKDDDKKKTEALLREATYKQEQKMVRKLPVGNNKEHKIMGKIQNDGPEEN